jgi:2-iminobutanoate/2-iminopropanoate deaminase
MLKVRVFIGLIVGLTVLAYIPLSAQNRVIMPEGMDMGLPFSPAISTGDVVFLSGSVGNLPGTKQVPGGIQEQTKQVFKNLSQVLQKAGLSMDDVISTNVYLADARHYQEMNFIYGQYFQKEPPVRTTVEGDMVIVGSLIEISAIAANPDLTREYVVPQGWPAPAKPYSWGILLEDTLFISGMVGRNVPSGRLVTESFEKQVEQAFDNVGTILKSAGMDFSNVVSARVYLSDSRDFQAMNEIYRRYFKTLPPVRATVKARLADPDMKIEIQCLAIRDISFSAVGDTSGNRPFSQGIKVDDWLLTAGMVGNSKDGLAKGDIRAQTRQTLANLKKTLNPGGLDFEDVVDVQVYLSDVRYYSDMNDVYKQIIPSTPPARATVGTPLMSPDVLVEIMMTAKKQ